MSKVVVVGGGIVGASAAFHLAREGVETVLIDRRDAGRATSAGAGIVAPGSSLRDSPGFYHLALPAVGYYPELVAALGDVDAGETGYQVCGKVFLAETDEQARDLDNVLALFNERRANGMPNLGEIQDIDGREAQRLFAALGMVPRALYIPEAARVDGALMRDALTTGARHYGAQVMLGAATPVMDQGRVTGVSCDGLLIEADAVVLAAGAWSNEMFEPLGFSLPVAPQKGQILHIRVEDQETTDWPILSWFGDQYILAFGPDRIVAGATREFGSGFDTRITPGGVKQVLDTALRIAPGLANGTLAEVRVGLRPYAEDGLPFMGMAPGHGNVVVATGHGPSGLQLGPHSGYLAAELVMGRTSPTDLTPFAVDREILASQG
jgi:D-amino-acid dehydrogenase